MRLVWVQLALALFQVDLSVKHEIDSNEKFDTEQHFLHDKVHIKKLHNYGMAGGRFEGHMPAIIRGSALATLGCVGFFFKTLWKDGPTSAKLGYALLTGGAMSNLYDRCRKGYVVDYVRFTTPFRRLSRLVFNLSDFMIAAGAILICLGKTDHS